MCPLSFYFLSERSRYTSHCSFVAVVTHWLSPVLFFVTPWTVACQDPLSPTVSLDFCPLFSHSLLYVLQFMSFESVMLGNRHILCHSRLLLSSIFPSIRVFCNELALHIRWPKYWSFSFSISSSSEYSGLISFRIDLFDLFAVQGALGISSSTTV